MIGSRVTAAILESTAHAKLRGLTRQALPFPHQPSIDLQFGDLLSEADCEEFVRGLDVVVHLAQSNNPASSNRHWPSDCTQNLLSTLNLLQAIRSHGNAPCHIVFASSGGAIYGDHPGIPKYDESLPCRPMSPYGIQKLAVEQYLQIGVAQGWLSACALRISNAYGMILPTERRQGLIGVAMAKHLQSQPVEIFGSPETVRDYVHIDDVARAFVSALDFRDGFHAINVASAEGHSVRDILNLIGEVSERTVETRLSTFAANQFALTPRLVLSNTMAKKLLAWEPRVSLQNGIENLWKSVVRKC